MSIKIFNNTAFLEKALDASWIRNEAISNNLANVDTPGYKRQNVEFEAYLAQAIDGKFKGYRTHEKHIPIGSDKSEAIKIKVEQDNRSTKMRLDDNNVDIDIEMAMLSKNNIYYNALIQQVSKQFNGLKSAIRDGGR